MNRSCRHVTANRRAMFALEHRNRKLEDENKKLKKFKKSIEDLMIIVMANREEGKIPSPHPKRPDIAISMEEVIDNMKYGLSGYAVMEVNSPSDYRCKILSMSLGGREMRLLGTSAI